MESVIKHAKVRTYMPQPDGKILIQTDTYHEKPAGFQQEIMQHKNTNRSAFLSDLIELTAPVTSKATRELVLTIVVDEQGDPLRITQVFTTKKELYPRR